MRRVVALIALFLLGGVVSASAQQKQAADKSKPQVIIIDRSQLRAPPPSPATPSYPPPRPEIGAPMPSPPPLPQMAPRVGN